MSAKFMFQLHMTLSVTKIMARVIPTFCSFHSLGAHCEIPVEIAHICTVCNGQLLQWTPNEQNHHFKELRQAGI